MMGHYTKPPYLGQRPHSVRRKIIKEIRHGRVKRESPQEFSISTQKRILNDLQERIAREENRAKREPLYGRFANIVASCPPKVCEPSEIEGIERYNDLKDYELLRSLSSATHHFRGSQPDFLPLHHLVKILSREVSQNGNDKFVYLLGSTSTSIPSETAVRNLRGLEYFLLTFAQRISVGQYLDLEVDGKRVRVPHHNEHHFGDKDQIVKKLRRELGSTGVTPSDHYVLRGIRDGVHEVKTTLHVIAEQRTYGFEGRQGNVAVAYLTAKHR